MIKNLISLEEILSHNKRHITNLFQETYNMFSNDISSIMSIESHQERIIASAELLFYSSISMGMSTCDALAQITSGNIAALASDWIEPEKDYRRTGAILSKLYHDEALSLEIANISILRREILKGYMGSKKELNALNSEKKPEMIQIRSKSDQRYGLKLPESLDVTQWFLIGIYRADGFPSNNDNNLFKLSGKTGDERLYQDILPPIIKQTFNLAVKPQVKKRSKKNKKCNTNWNDVYIEITSQGHYSYLRDYLGLFTDEGEFNPLCIDNFSNENPYLSTMAYIIGMIAGAGHISTRKQKNGSPRRKLEFQDKDSNYLPELISAINTTGLSLSYSNPPKKPYYMHFNQSQLEKMARYDPGIRIHEEQVGLFVNPRHITALKEYGIID